MFVEENRNHLKNRYKISNNFFRKDRIFFQFCIFLKGETRSEVFPLHGGGRGTMDQIGYPGSKNSELDNFTVFDALTKGKSVVQTPILLIIAYILLSVE